MSIQSYAVGFTKVAEAAGIDPEDLLDYMRLGKQAGLGSALKTVFHAMKPKAIKNTVAGFARKHPDLLGGIGVGSLLLGGAGAGFGEGWYARGLAGRLGVPAGRPDVPADRPDVPADRPYVPADTTEGNEWGLDNIKGKLKGAYNDVSDYVSSHKGLVGGVAAASSVALASLLIARAMRNKKKKIYEEQ